MTDDFNISWVKYDKEINDPKINGANMKITTFCDLKPTDENERCRAQFYESNTRIGENNLNWDLWTQVIYIDVDTKFYYRNGGDVLDEKKIKDTPVAFLYAMIYNWIFDHYKYNINDAEYSRSRLGFHFYFKWDCDRTEENRIYYNEVSRAIVYKAFCECGYKEIIDYPKVFDNCTTSYFQLVYPTKINWIHNKTCDGRLTYYGGLELRKDVIKKKKNNTIKKQYNEIRNIINEKTGLDIKRHHGKYDIELVRKFDVDKVDYIEHTIRWKLFDSLSCLFKDEDELHEEWIKCCEKIPPANGHDLQFYINEPYKQYQSYTWNKQKDEDCYCDIELLKVFGYDVRITKVSSDINKIFNEIFN